MCTSRSKVVWSSFVLVVVFAIASPAHAGLILRMRPTGEVNPKDLTGDFLKILRKDLGGATLDVSAQGVLSIGGGGNLLAQRIRDLIEESSDYTISVGTDIPGILFDNVLSDKDFCPTKEVEFDMADLLVLQGKDGSDSATFSSAVIHGLWEAFQFDEIAKEEKAGAKPRAHREAILIENEILKSQGGGQRNLDFRTFRITDLQNKTLKGNITVNNFKIWDPFIRADGTKGHMVLTFEGAGNLKKVEPGIFRFPSDVFSGERINVVSVEFVASVPEPSTFLIWSAVGLVRVGIRRVRRSNTSGGC